MTNDLSRGAGNRPSLARASLFTAAWYPSVILGLVMLLVALFRVSTAHLSTNVAALIMTAVLLVLLELRPLVQGSGHDPQGVVMSTAFSMAILFLWGPWPAVLVVSIASAMADMRAHKTAWKCVFNVGQYNVSIGAGWLVMTLAGRSPSLDHPLGRTTGLDLTWMLGSCIAYFLTNLMLVAAVLAWQSSFLEQASSDFLHYTATTFSVLALSPLVVVVANTAWELLPLLLIPLVLVFKMAQMSLEREHQAGHDPLTGLPNRVLLQESLAIELAKSKRDGRPFGLLLIDLDHFKEVNDTLGHHVGDQLLVHFAARLSNSVRPGDHLARLGGDEFAVIVPDADETEVLGVAERIRASLANPVALEGMMLEIEASIGVAMHPEHAYVAEDLLRLSDVAMYIAKESRSGVATYSAHRDRNSADRLTLLGELRQALDEGVLTLQYQPKVSLADYSLMGVEALIRWQHPQRGFIPPDEFIPLAERSGIMHLLTDRVVSLALAQLASWRDQGLIVPVAVNVSLTDLLGGQLADLVLCGLREHALPTGMLQLEITERVVAQQTEELNVMLLDLETLGVTLSLDDFGTGYSSLLRLQSLPVREIKIDRAFVSRLSESSSTVGIVRAIVDLAHALGMPAIAEGVETEAEWQVLRELGCDGAQGWHIAAPMSPEQATEWLIELNRAGTGPVRLASPVPPPGEAADGAGRTTSNEANSRHGTIGMDAAIGTDSTVSLNSATDGKRRRLPAASTAASLRDESRRDDALLGESVRDDRNAESYDPDAAQVS
ncbi:MAG TPA: EAL domain-containing protein [Jatrophihabitans sp.]|nr:EAL domain-containing protein [Jatrophihabitans sp.]